MPLTQLNHVNILAADLEATKAFYVDVLGLKVGPRPNFSFPGAWIYLGDTAVLHLVGKSSGDMDYLNSANLGAVGTGCIDHVAFTCTDFEAFRDRLEKQGVPMRHRKVPNQEIYQIFVKDPNGVTIELNFPIGQDTRW